MRCYVHADKHTEGKQLQPGFVDHFLTKFCLLLLGIPDLEACPWLLLVAFVTQALISFWGDVSFGSNAVLFPPETTARASASGSPVTHLPQTVPV